MAWLLFLLLVHPIYLYLLISVVLGVSAAIPCIILRDKFFVYFSVLDFTSTLPVIFMLSQALAPLLASENLGACEPKGQAQYWKLAQWVGAGGGGREWTGIFIWG